MGEEKRHEMMETLFGAESEDSDDEPETVRQAVSDQASDRSVSFFFFIFSTIASSPPSPSVSRIVRDCQPSQLSGHARTTGRSLNQSLPGMFSCIRHSFTPIHVQIDPICTQNVVVKSRISLTLYPSYSLQRI